MLAFFHEDAGGVLPWPILALGASFAIPGALVFAGGLRSVRHRARAKSPADRFPGETWRYDYPSDPAQITDDSTRRIVRTFGIFVFLLKFLTPFNAVVFGIDETPTWVKVIIGIFDIFLPVFLGMLVTQLVRRLVGKRR